MITFENGALTTDATLSATDTQAIFQFADYCAQAERERIIAKLTEYVIDLRECGKKDNCLDIAIAVEGQIEDIKGEQK